MEAAPYRIVAFAEGFDPGAGEVRYIMGAGFGACLLYTSDAADERSSVDLGGRRIIKKKTSSYLLLRRLRSNDHRTTRYRSRNNMQHNTV